MSIPIPLILALLAQKNSHPQNASGAPQNQIVPTEINQVHISRQQQSKNIVAKLNGVAQIVGGQRGAKIGSIAKVVGAVGNINSPMNVLSLLAKGSMHSSAGGMFNKPSVPNMQGASNIYNNINNMLNNMDKGKKDELLSMAESIMKPQK